VKTFGRDPFARAERVRIIDPDAVSCAWCGLRPKRLYNYGTWRDDKAEPYVDLLHAFCNKECYDAFQEV
jgi:hypothetical protein